MRDKMTLSLGNGGWVQFRRQGKPTVMLRFEDVDGRFVPMEIHVDAERGLNTDLLRDVPLGQVEAWVNAVGVAERLRDRLNLPSIQMRVLASHFSASLGSRRYWGRNWVFRMLASQIPDSDEERVAVSAVPPSFTDAVDDAPVNATLPFEGDAGDFYRELAAVYQRLAKQTSKPIQVIAEANGVEPSRVRGWVQTARRQGLLQSGKRGKAG